MYFGGTFIPSHDVWKNDWSRSSAAIGVVSSYSGDDNNDDDEDDEDDEDDDNNTDHHHNDNMSNNQQPATSNQQQPATTTTRTPFHWTSWGTLLKQQPGAQPGTHELGESGEKTVIFSGPKDHGRFRTIQQPSNPAIRWERKKTSKPPNIEPGRRNSFEFWG